MKDAVIGRTCMGLATVLAACVGTGLSAQPSGPYPSGSATWITLGTGGGPLLRTERGGPANALVIGNDATLFDAGDGVVREIAAAGLRLDQIHTIVLSHLHPDHIAGLAALIALRWQMAATTHLEIVGPQGTPDLVAGIVAAMKPVAGTEMPGEKTAFPDTWITTREIACAGETVTFASVRMKAVRNTHFLLPDGTDSKSATSCAFRIEAGGRTIVYTGDTGPSAAVSDLAKGADLLVSEVIDLDAAIAMVERQAPNLSVGQRAGVRWHLAHHHLTPSNVGTLARDAGVKSVVLTHLVPGTDHEDPAPYAQGVRRIFDGPVTVAKDGDRF